MVEIDQQKEKADRIEFLGASSSFLERAVAAAQVSPEILPLVTQMLLFGIRGFKVGRELEGVFENFQEEAKKKVEQMQANPKPSPAEQEMQAKMQLEQAKAQAEAQKADMDAQMEKYKADIKAQTDLQVAQMRAETDIKLKAMDKSGELVEYDELGKQQASAVIQNTLEQSNSAMQQNMAAVIQAIQASNEQQTQALATMLSQLTKPKAVVRDNNGKIIGVQ